MEYGVNELIEDVDKGEELITVDMRGINSWSTERFPASWVNGDIWSTDGFENAPGIGGGVLQRRIAVDGCDTQEIQGRIMSGNQDCKGILTKRISSVRSVLYMCLLE